jgi:hypothetical protein
MLTTNFKNQVINLLTGRINQMSYGNITVGLSYTEPTVTPPSGTISYNEPSPDTGYERVFLGSYQQSLTLLMSASEDGYSENIKNIFFPKALIDYPFNVTHFMIFGGNTMLAWDTLTNPVKPLRDTVPIVEIGNLKIEID